MRFIPIAKLFITFFCSIFLAVFLKWTVDVCLPDYDRGYVFPKALSVPESVCSPVMKWDLWAREEFRPSFADSNWYVQEMGGAKKINGQKDHAIFKTVKSVLSVTILLEKIPNDADSFFKIFAIILALAVISAMMWQLLEMLITYPTKLQMTLNSTEQQRARQKRDGKLNTLM